MRLIRRMLSCVTGGPTGASLRKKYRMPVSDFIRRAENRTGQYSLGGITEDLIEIIFAIGASRKSTFHGTAQRPLTTEDRAVKPDRDRHMPMMTPAKIMIAKIPRIYPRRSKSCR